MHVTVGVQFPRRVQRQGSVGHEENVRVLWYVIDELAYVLDADAPTVMEQEAHRNFGVRSVACVDVRGRRLRVGTGVVAQRHDPVDHFRRIDGVFFVVSIHDCV